ncbi:MAG: A/G-specific adenine glycosylase [Deltaproteobacteria bacterium]|nr:A/G-specific adenine glycosylase [Deltaproteobacteria bacterium]
MAATAVRRSLMRWYRLSRRDLPWRGTTDPYRIWVSEVLLQQTQAERVTEYYVRFLSRFPTLSSLASATWRQLLPVWRGLGYYSRGRNMLAAAKLMRLHHRGRVPANLESLESLPGIGPYTARAIMSFAYGKPLPALDTNLRRVIGRVFGVGGEDLPLAAEALFAGARNGNLNHALMDLGAMVCKARTPLCARCPLNRFCVAFGTGALPVVVHLPAPRNKPAIDVGVGCIHRDGKYLIAKRHADRGGNWEFPGGKREKGEDIRACLKRELREELGIEVAVRPAFFKVEYSNQRGRFRLHFCRCQILRGKPKALDHDAIKWISLEELLHHPFPEANRAALEKL